MEDTQIEDQTERDDNVVEQSSSSSVSNGNGGHLSNDENLQADMHDDPIRIGIAANGKPVHPELYKMLLELESLLDKQIVLLIQTEVGDHYDMISPEVSSIFVRNKKSIDTDRGTALVIDSPGGIASSAYEIAHVLNRGVRRFTAVVPRYAKSAATILTLGADQIQMGPDAELGPLDVQIFDSERESRNSALDEVLSLERLNAFAMQASNEMMLWFLQKSGKRIDVLLPMVLDYVAKMMRPLLEDVDAVRYSQRSRSLKIAEEYGLRLLEGSYPREQAEAITFNLVWNYPEHGFPIYSDEARNLGLNVPDLSSNISEVLDRIAVHLMDNPTTLIGPIVQEVVLDANEHSFPVSHIETGNGTN